MSECAVREFFGALGGCAEHVLDNPRVANARLRVAGEYSRLSGVVDRLEHWVPDERMVECDGKLQDLVCALRKDVPDAACIGVAYQALLDAAVLMHTPSAQGYNVDAINQGLAEFYAAADAGQQDRCQEISERIAEHLPVVLEKCGGRMRLSLVEGGGCRVPLASASQCAQVSMDGGRLCVGDTFSMHVVQPGALRGGQLSGVLQGDSEVQDTCGQLGDLLKRCAVGMSSSYGNACGKPTTVPESGVGKIAVGGLEYDLEYMFKNNKQDLLSAISNAAQVSARPGSAVLVDGRWMPAHLWVNPGAVFSLGQRDLAIGALKDLRIPGADKLQRYKEDLRKLSDVRAKVALESDAEKEKRMACSAEVASRCAAALRFGRIQQDLEGQVLRQISRL